MINRVVLVGRLTKDPELRYTPSGIPMTRFTIAVNRTFTSQSGEREADFLGCIAWRKQAENLANFMRKGNLVGIEGRIQTGSFEGQDGKRVYTTDVIADSIQFLEPPSRQRNRQNSSDNYQSNTNYQQNNQTQYNANTGQSQLFGNSGQFNQQQDPFASNNAPGVNPDDLPF